MPDFIPRRDAELVNFSRNFSQRLSDAPGDYQISPERAAELAAMQQEFAALYQATTGNGTRTPAGIVAKDESRARLVKALREVSHGVRTSPAIPLPLKIQLGLRVRTGAGRVTPFGPPATAPVIHTRMINPRTLRVTLCDAEAPTRIARPATSSGAMVFAHVGEHPPTDPREWTVRKSTGRTTVDLEFNGIDLPQPAARVWVTAHWFCRSARGIRALHTVRANQSPWSAPVVTWILPAAQPARIDSLGLAA